jgi:hypothetical protein
LSSLFCGGGFGVEEDVVVKFRTVNNRGKDELPRWANRWSREKIRTAQWVLAVKSSLFFELIVSVVTEAYAWG